MSDSASGRPFPPSAPSERARKTVSETSRSIVEPTRAISETSRTTGVRPRAPSQDPVISDVPPPLEETRASIPPESLRKPYASLPPAPKKTTTSPRRPMPSSSAWDDTSSLSSPSIKPSNGSCKKHRIARRSDGVCMMCRKEELEADTGRGWKILVSVVLLAVAGGAVAAALV